MKVLFLDVDGVLNMHGSGGYMALNRKRMQLLKKIIEETGAVIVLSSTWRNHPDAMKKLNRNLRYRGLKIHDVTPSFGVHESGERYYRGHEIQDWLDRHSEVTNYVILDDDSDMLDSQLRNFIQTDGKIGLTETLAYRASYILNNGTNSIKQFPKSLSDEKLSEIKEFNDQMDTWCRGIFV